MNWEEKIEEQLRTPYRPNLKKRISYYESQPLRQIQMDTAFFTLPLTNKIVPVLVIVDVATKYVRYYLQKTKNDKIASHLRSFIEEVGKKFKRDNPSKETILITDGAGELAIKSIKNVTHSVSTSKNKAAVAEAAIARARRLFRKKENKANVLNIKENTNKHYVTLAKFQKFLDEIANELNVKAKVNPPPNRKDDDKYYPIGTPVFALNMAKFFPQQMGEGLKKTSYHQNWLYEPFWVSNIKKVQNIYKYTLTGYQDDQEAKYYFYSDQIMEIDPKIADIYVTKFLQYIQKK